MSENKNSNKLDFSLLGKVLALARPYRGMFISSIVLAVVLSPLSPLRSKLIQVLVDDTIMKSDTKGLLFWTLISVGLLIVEAFLQYIFLYNTSLLGQLSIRDLRVKVFKHISSLRLSYFDTTPIGTSTTRTINDIETINTVFSQGTVTIVSDLLTVVLVFVFMFMTSWKLTLVCLTTAPFLIIASYIFKEKTKVSFNTVRNQVAKMNAFLQERISGMRIVQVFNAEQKEMQKFKEINRTYTQANIDSIFYYAVFFPVVEIISAASLALIVWYGSRGVLNEDVTLGALIAFPLYINMLFRPIRMLADKFNTLQMGLIAAERVFKLLDNQTKIENNGTLKPAHLAGNIVFKNVSFSYNDKDWVLKDVNFELESGKTMAIVGSTGSGKSTIINLLSRFYDIQKGEISINGENLFNFELDNLRKKIAVVLQDVFLFSGSVLDNITLRDSSISREQVIEAAKMIGAHEFIEKLPNGYDYQVMERGATLSMGQRQLISFVRALVFEPDILILDEATSSIDSETEGVIQYAIEKLIDKRTSIIIAHRLSTIRHANKILVLSKGEVKEFGSHEDLLKIDNGHYRNLYELQFESNLSAS